MFLSKIRSGGVKCSGVEWRGEVEICGYGVWGFGWGDGVLNGGMGKAFLRREGRGGGED